MNGDKKQQDDPQDEPTSSKQPTDPFSNAGSDQVAPPTKGSDIFADLDKLRLGQSYDNVGVKKVLSMVPCRRPPKQDFVRVNPDPAFSFTTRLLILKDEFTLKGGGSETYVVSPELWAELPGDLVPVALFTAITRAGNLFIWPVKLPDATKRGNSGSWSTSDRDAVEDAKKSWVKVEANMQNSAYDRSIATGNLPEPVWPVDVTFREILKIAFRDRVIDSMDHPILRRLRGETM